LTPRIIPRGLFFVQVPENPSNRNAPILIVKVTGNNNENQKAQAVEAKWRS